MIKTIAINSLNNTNQSFKGQQSKLIISGDLENSIVNEMEEVGLDDGLTQNKDEVDPNLTGMNNMAGMAHLNSAVFDQSIRHFGQ